MQARQLLTLSGLASVILLVISFAGLSQSTPEGDATGAEVKTFYTDHSSRQQAAAYVVILAVPLLIFFAAAVRTALIESGERQQRAVGQHLPRRRARRRDGFLLAACFHLALTTAPEDFSTSTMQALNAIEAESWVGFGGGIGIMLLGAAGAMLPAASGVRWLGWIALALGVLMFTPVGFFAFLGLGPVDRPDLGRTDDAAALAAGAPARELAATSRLI